MHAYKTHAKTMHLVKLVLRRRDTAVYALMDSEAHTVTKDILHARKFMTDWRPQKTENTFCSCLLGRYMPTVTCQSTDLEPVEVEDGRWSWKLTAISKRFDSTRNSGTTRKGWIYQLDRRCLTTKRQNYPPIGTQISQRSVSVWRMDRTPTSQLSLRRPAPCFR